jgi:hypothetical protein
LKLANVDFTCEIKDVDLNVAQDLTLSSSNKEFIAYYDELTKRFQNTTKTKTANLSFDMAGKVLKKSNVVIWYLPMSIFINQVINMEMTNSEVK